MVTCLIVDCLFMTAFYCSLPLNPGNNLFMMGLKPGSIKVKDIVTVIL